ncbi:D-alanyl-D-alanine carboxypeptidase family protein [Nitrincola alkalilacustris]|uniref:D-alanyl-D-alanine carboxypeptidase family protein n=1 Tax=Nitrincola alkalilacustris TaxID=1571224 RepID=UPI00124EE69F|nr:D-alanyl-D-alanine carboxypeptidase family protein [Nitrincola alkalilacustris]
MAIRRSNPVSAILLALVLLLATLPVLASTLIPAPPQVAARAWLVMDPETGVVIAAHNEHERFAPASLTKMMTSYIVERELQNGNISEQDMVTISEKAWRTGGSRMFVQVGTQVSVIDLLKGVIIQSGNDASVALAEYVAGSERAFADMMNQHAARLGMVNTNFENSTGLPGDQHYSSAMDLAILGRALIIESPDYYKLNSEKEFTYNEIRQPNRNRLLWRDESVDGIKTGFTNDAGYCLVTSAVRDGMRLITVVMGADSEEARAQQSQSLLNYAFRFYRTQSLYDAGQVMNESRIWGGDGDLVRLGVAERLAVTLPRGQEDSVEVTLDMPRHIKAPVMQGQELGQVVVSMNGEQLRSMPLVALESVEQGSLLKRIWHAIMLFFLGFFS